VSARDTAHVGMTLLGFYLIVSGLASVVISLNQPLVYSFDGEPISSSFVSIATVGFARILFAGIFSFLPGALLIARSAHWSDALFSSAGSSDPLPASSLYAIGLLLLGLYLSITGLASIASALLMSGIPTNSNHEGILRLSGSGTVYLVSGATLFLLGRRALRNAA